MPKRDGTGPMSSGSMSGRGLGPCTSVNAARGRAAFSRGCSYRHGRGLGMGLGIGCKRSLGRNLVGKPLEMTDKEALSEKKEFFQRRLESIDKQLKNF